MEIEFRDRELEFRKRNSNSGIIKDVTLADSLRKPIGDLDFNVMLITPLLLLCPYTAITPIALLHSGKKP